MAQGPASNLLASLRRVFGTLIAMGRTRFELLVVEFEEERARLGVLLLLGALLLFLLSTLPLLRLLGLPLLRLLLSCLLARLLWLRLTGRGHGTALRT